jgi:hypothetical protein
LRRRKAAPLKDLCALGEWKDPQTILKCYQRADPVTMRQAPRGSQATRSLSNRDTNRDNPLPDRQAETPQRL